MASASSGELGGRQALVTGGTGATGSVIASRLRQEGAVVWTVARSMPDDHPDPEHFIGAERSMVVRTTTLAMHLPTPYAAAKPRQPHTAKDWPPRSPPRGSGQHRRPPASSARRLPNGSWGESPPRGLPRPRAQPAHGPLVGNPTRSPRRI